jgi:hypothetical protein
MPDDRMTRDDVAAAQRAAHRQGFYIHLLVYVCVMALLVLINAVTPASPWWVQWPLVAWGIGVIAHGLAAFRR